MPTSVEASEISPQRAAAALNAFWVAACAVTRALGEPKLVAEITFLTWTADDLLRQTVYVGLRDHKPPEQVRREVKT